MSEVIRNYTQRLFATPSLTEGIGRIFDFFSLFESYNIDKTEKEADTKAIYSDWKAVGEDLRFALIDYGNRK